MDFAVMSAMLRCGLLLLIAVVLLSAHNTSANNSRPPRNNDISNMADALRYLQDLDAYYGDRARARYDYCWKSKPRRMINKITMLFDHRFGKRAPLVQLLRQHLLENPELVSNLNKDKI